jgi:chromosome segregation ATPase
MDRLTITIGVSTLIISTISLFIAIKARKSTLRENLYNRQLDVFQELFSSIIELEHALSSWLGMVDSINNDEDLPDDALDFLESEIEEIEEEIDELSTELDIELSKAQLLLPDEMSEKFGNFMKAYRKIELKKDKLKLKEEDLSKFSDSILDLEDAIREFIGLEKLSRDNRLIIRT